MSQCHPREVAPGEASLSVSRGRNEPSSWRCWCWAGLWLRCSCSVGLVVFYSSTDEGVLAYAGPCSGRRPAELAAQTVHLSPTIGKHVAAPQTQHPAYASDQAGPV